MTIYSNLTRPASLSEWSERSQRLLAPVLTQSIQHGLTYQPNPTDVFISPMVKCGTTWLQQIVHSLKTRGDMDFDDMLQVMPWLEISQWLGHDLYAQQRGSFRAFKSHFSWDAIPKGGRYIVSFREPTDALISDYNFVDGYSWEAGAVSFEEHAKIFMSNRQGDGGWETNYWKHLVSWWKQRDNPQVLLLCYEKMKIDLPGTVQKIADFLEIELDQSLRELVNKHASREYMLAHKAKFSGRLLQQAMAEVGYTPPSDTMSMVKKIRVNNQELNAALQAEMDALWQEIVTAQTGIPSYQALYETF